MAWIAAHFDWLLTALGFFGVYVTFVRHVWWATWWGIFQSALWIPYFILRGDNSLILNSAVAIGVLAYGIFNDHRVSKRKQLSEIISEQGLTDDLEGCIL